MRNLVDLKSNNDPNDCMFMILISNDNHEFQIAKDAAKVSKLIQSLLDDESDDDEDEEITRVHIHKVRGEILAKVIDFCNQHDKDPMPEIITPIASCDIDNLVPTWYANFVKQMDWKCLQDLVLAANFMHISPLIRLSVLAVSLHINMKTVDEIKTMLAIPYDIPSSTPTNAKGSKPSKKYNLHHVDADEEQNLWLTHYMNAVPSMKSNLP